MLPARLNVVTLGVRDLPRVRAFYEALGWPCHADGDDFARFDTGGAVLSLFPLERLADEAGQPAAFPSDAFSGVFRGVTLATVVEERGLVDACLDQVRAAGGTIKAEAVDREWGGRSGYFADPEGNAWEVAWLPWAAFDERGGLIWEP